MGALNRIKRALNGLYGSLNSASLGRFVHRRRRVERVKKRRILMLASGLAIAVGLADGRIAEGAGILVAILLAYWNEHRAAREFDVHNRSEPEHLRRIGSHRKDLNAPVLR